MKLFKLSALSLLVVSTIACQSSKAPVKSSQSGPISASPKAETQEATPEQVLAGNLQYLNDKTAVLFQKIECSTKLKIKEEKQVTLEFTPECKDILGEMPSDYYCSEITMSCFSEEANREFSVANHTITFKTNSEAFIFTTSQR